MDTKQLPQAASRESQMRTTLANLAEEDARLRLPILEAASIAAQLCLDPGDLELRQRAAKIWARIDSVIARHLRSGDRFTRADRSRFDGHAQPDDCDSRDGGSGYSRSGLPAAGDSQRLCFVSAHTHQIIRVDY